MPKTTLLLSIFIIFIKNTKNTAVQNYQTTILYYPK